MNPLVLLVAPVILLFGWTLVVAMRTGQYSFRSGGQRTPGATSFSTTHTIRRGDAPVAFWALAIFNVGLIVYLAYTATQIE